MSRIHGRKLFLLKSDFNKRRKRVFVGLSGGVDSSVSAALLKKQGYEVTGVFIKVWQPEFFSCGWKNDRLDAMRVCAKLGIPFVELDLEKEYKKEVVDYMIREYKAGKTPNPDVFCNRFIKFGGFYRWACAQGADYIATGHYARIRIVKDKGLRIKDFGLLSGSDPQKDQSYFLWQLRKEQLPHILFPVGGMKKPEVRRLAKKFGLITADKKDSQGLCFVGKVDMKEFLSHYIKPKRGEILLAADERGLKRGLTQMKREVIGEHEGAFFYTLGERIAVNLSPAANTRLSLVAQRVPIGPYYVIAKDIRKNILTVSHKSPAGNLSGAVREVAIKDCNWLAEPKAGKPYRARVRYRQPLQKCRIVFPRVVGVSPRLVRIAFASPQTAAPGQSLVLYDGDLCLGGGVIAD